MIYYHFYKSIKYKNYKNFREFMEAKVIIYHKLVNTKYFLKNKNL